MEWRPNPGETRTVPIHPELTLLLVCMNCHQPTKDYVARRTAEGRTNKEILCCLKRYIVRETSPACRALRVWEGRQR